MWISFPSSFVGLQIEGIFRRSANVSLVKDIKQKYNSGKVMWCSLHISCSQDRSASVLRMLLVCVYRRGSEFYSAGQCPLGRCDSKDVPQRTARTAAHLPALQWHCQLPQWEHKHTNIHHLQIPAASRKHAHTHTQPHKHVCTPPILTFVNWFAKTCFLQTIYLCVIRCWHGVSGRKNSEHADVTSWGELCITALPRTVPCSGNVNT